MDSVFPYACLPAVIAQRASAAPSAALLGQGTRVMTYASCAERMTRTAAGLIRRGLSPGSIVVSLLSTRADTLRVFLAVTAAGGVLAPLNRWILPDALRAALASLRPDWVIADEKAPPLLDRLGAVLPPRARWIAVPGDGGSNSWAGLEASRSEASIPHPAPDDLCYIDFTSGSSGAPKGVPRTHGSIWAISCSAVAALGLSPQDCHLSLFAPFAHPHEALARAAFLGGMLVMVETLRPSAIAAAVARHRVTCIMAVPTVYRVLVERLDGRRLATLRLLESGGAVTPEPLIDAFRARLGVPLTPVWGCTEAGGIALAGGGEERPAGAVGRLCPGFEARVVPAQADAVVSGEAAARHGELALRGPSLAREYFRLPDETARAFRDGWYFTGDIFSRDDAGFYSFRGRHDEMIKVRGLKVFPTEIERVLMLHPDVAEAAVIAGEDSDSRPIAFVVARAGAVLNATALRAFCRSHLAPYAVPHIVPRHRLARTPSGKILKRRLHSAVS